MNYWVLRTDKNQSRLLFSELEAGRLRQGWGWDERQNLRCLTMDKGARRNKRMMQVKKGDLVLALHLPCYGQVALCEATDDWDSGYKFEVLNVGKGGDYGHIFPAKRLKSFHIRNESVPGGIRSTLRNRGRFWNINGLGSEVDALRTASADLGSASTSVARWEAAIDEVAKELDIKQLLSKKIHKFTQKSEWEHVIAEALRTLHPEWVVSTTSNRKEFEHGTDILVRLPTLGVFDDSDYAICIQVKDYAGKVGIEPVTQIRKAIEGYKGKNLKVIDLVVMMTNVKSDLNEELQKAADEGPLSVKLLWREDIDELIANASLIKLSQRDL